MIPCPACLRNVTVNRHAIHTLFLVLPVWSTCNSTVTVFTALFTTGTLCLVVEFKSHSVCSTIYNRNTLSCRGIQQYSVCSTIYNRNTLSCRGIQQSQCLQHYLQQEHFVLSWNSRVTVFTALFTTGTLCLVSSPASPSPPSQPFSKPLRPYTMSDTSQSVCQTTPTMSDISLSGVCQTTTTLSDISLSGVCQTTPTMSDISLSDVRRQHQQCQTDHCPCVRQHQQCQTYYCPSVRQHHKC